MTKLQVELAKENIRIKTAVRKKSGHTKVTVSRSTWSVDVHAWLENAIIKSYHMAANLTTKQIIQRIKSEV
jgi:hypothetical protein